MGGREPGGDPRGGVRGRLAGPDRGGAAAEGRNALEDDLSRPIIDAVWSAQDTNPGAIEAALRGLVNDLHAQNAGYVPARALNLVCIVDQEWSGEIANRLRRVGRNHASRTIVCSIEPGRTTIDARAMVASEVDPPPGEYALLRETIVLSIGERHVPGLAAIVDPLVVTDIATVVWSPHGHAGAVDALTAKVGSGDPLAQVVLLDSADEPDPAQAMDRICRLAERVSVVDLAWLRCTPWRERLAATFDPPIRRPELATLAKVSVRHGSDSTISGLLLIGWLCARLGWRPEALTRHDELLRGRARGRRGEIELRLEPVVDMTVPGLAGLEVRSDRGTQLGLARGEGGLTARRIELPARGSSDPIERRWTVLGASRGEAGILGEGIRQALLRDPIYRPTLAAARKLLG